jgi:hypothetical protein
MNPNLITLSTPAGASIVLDHSTITITADNIVLVGNKGVIMTASAGDFVVHGTPKIKLNP